MSTARHQVLGSGVRLQAAVFAALQIGIGSIRSTAQIAPDNSLSRASVKSIALIENVTTLATGGSFAYSTTSPSIYSFEEFRFGYSFPNAANTNVIEIGFAFTNQPLTGRTNLIVGLAINASRAFSYIEDIDGFYDTVELSIPSASDHIYSVPLNPSSTNVFFSIILFAGDALNLGDTGRIYLRDLPHVQELKLASAIHDHALNTPLLGYPHVLYAGGITSITANATNISADWIIHSTNSATVVVDASLLVSAEVISASGSDFTFLGQAGHTYLIECSTNLPQNEWIAAATSVVSSAVESQPILFEPERVTQVTACRIASTDRTVWDFSSATQLVFGAKRNKPFTPTLLCTLIDIQDHRVPFTFPSFMPTTSFRNYSLALSAEHVPEGFDPSRVAKLEFRATTLTTNTVGGISVQTGIGLNAAPPQMR